MRFNWDRNRILLCAGLVQGAVSAVLLVVPNAAVASGGATVATAPLVALGQQEFGNTATDNGEQTLNHCSLGPETGNSWWNLPVSAGDRVTIDFESDPSVDVGLAVFSVGTTDFQVGTIGESHYATPDSNGKGYLNFTATAAGNMPIDFFDCATAGPYDFIAYIQHGLIVSLKQSSSSRHNHRTSFSVAAWTPSGALVTSTSLREDVQLRSEGRWITLETLTAPTAFKLTWSRARRGKFQSVRVVVHGPGFVTATSRTIRVRAA